MKNKSDVICAHRPERQMAGVADDERGVARLWVACLDCHAVRDGGPVRRPRRPKTVVAS
jgi:hypothetical protein